MKKDVRRYIELICCDMRNRDECILQDIPCENCPYNEQMKDDDHPCYEAARSDLEDLWKDDENE